MTLRFWTDEAAPFVLPGAEFVAWYGRDIGRNGLIGPPLLFVLQVIGGSVWGSFPDGYVSLGSSADAFRATSWLGYN